MTSQKGNNRSDFMSQELHVSNFFIPLHTYNLLHRETIDDKRLGLDHNPVPVHLLQSVPNPVVPFAAVISTPPKESLHILSK
jgi:hypothetical protein